MKARIAIKNRYEWSYAAMQMSVYGNYTEALTPTEMTYFEVILTPHTIICHRAGGTLTEEGILQIYDYQNLINLFHGIKFLPRF